MEVQNPANIQKFAIKRGLWDSKVRKLIMASDHLSYEEGIIGEDAPTTIIPNEIKDLRYGIIRKNRFFLEFQIFIRTSDDKILKIDFSSFAWKHEQALKHFNEICHSIWENISKKIVQGVIDKIRQGEEAEMCTVKISLDKILIQKSGLFKSNEKSIEWPDLGIKLYRSGFDIYSKQNPHDVNRKFSYLEEWNAVLLLSILRTVETAKNRGLK